MAAATAACVLAFAGTATAAGPSSHGHHTKKITPLVGAAKVEAESTRALRQAQKTGQSVPVNALTTPTSTTAADPDGNFTLSQSLQPVRAWKDGAWKTLDAALHLNADHTLSPTVASTGLVSVRRRQRPAGDDDRDRTHAVAVVADAAPHTHHFGSDRDLPVGDERGRPGRHRFPQGGFSDTLVVKTKQAAADPGLAKLTLATASNDLSVTADAAGNLKAAATATGDAVFSAVTPTMWDSATAGTPQAKAATTAPADVTEPSPDSHTAPVAVTADDTKHTITLTPDQDLLTSSATVYPVYIDPTWVTQDAGSSRQAWAQTDTINKSAAHYKPSELQNGYCAWDTCIPTFTAESYVRMSVPSELQGAQIYRSELDLTVAYGPYSSCSSAPNPGLELWWTGAISSSTTWNNAPSWKQKLDTQNPPACSGQNVGFSLTSFMQSHAQGASSLTFGIAAASETDKNAWKQFHASTLTMSTSYDRAPTLPSHPATSPGGPCQTGAPSATIIGDDDVTFETVASDPDGGPLGTQFVIKNYGGAVVYDSGDAKTAPAALTSTSGGVVRLLIRRTLIQGWHPEDGVNTPKAHTYSWYTRASDGKLYSPTTGTGSSGSPCNFTYDPTKPATSPGISVTTNTDGDAGALGQNGTFTIAPCAGALADPPTTCAGTAPNRYTYQINSSPPLSITATGSAQTAQIPLTHAGPNTLTVFSITSGGNPGESASTDFTVTGPASSYPDGDVNGDTHPDLLTVGTTTNPGLWLAGGDGTANLSVPTDIGAAGTGINTSGAPADWNGAHVLHGDFTGNHVQDVLAYYPTGTYAGESSIMSGNGDALPIDPYSGSHLNLSSDVLADYTLNANGDIPSDLVAAGNASLTGTGIADLIGITGDATNGYQLDLYTTCGLCNADHYGYYATLADQTQSPDGASDWNNFALTTAQPATGTVLFALKKTTGELWEATNPTQDPSKPIGTPTSAGGTWTKITVPWGSTAPTLVSGDITTSGAIQLWGQAGTTATPYSLAGTTITKGTAVSLLAPSHEWPLTSNSGPTSSCTATLCTPDTRGSADIPATGGVTFPGDDTHGIVADLDGTGYLTAPANMLHSSNTLTLTLSFRADPSTNGILFSTGNDTPDKANPAAMPVMYIGTDGRLYAQFWNGTVTPMISPQPVNDGQWHTATLNAYDDGTGAYHQGLYLDNAPRIGMAGHAAVNNGDPLNYIGAGVFPADTSTKTWINAPGTTTKNRASYFRGQIADVAYYARYLTTDQLSAWWTPIPLIGPIVSGVSSALCITDDASRTTNGNMIMIYTCNNTPAQNWSINPDGPEGTISTTLSGVTKCMDVTGNGTGNGTLIQLYTCDGSPGEDWHLDSNGQIWNPNSGRCLDDPSSSTTNGTQLQIHDCNLTNAQSWSAP